LTLKIEVVTLEIVDAYDCKGGLLDWEAPPIVLVPSSNGSYY